MIRSTLVLMLGIVALSGCKDNPECERARLNLSKSWHALVESASRRQLAGVDVEGWNFVKDKVALLESSFMTSQVTWDSAEKARKDLTARLPTLQTDTPANAEGFRLSVDAALKEQDAYAQKCR